MTSRRSLAVSPVLALGIGLALEASARAAGGGGSARFGGGGGGGRGGRGGFVGGAGGGSPIILLVIVAVVLVLVSLGLLAARRARRERDERLRRVELAAAEAAAEDPAFDADVVRARAAELFAAVQAAWDARDLARLARLAGPNLLEEWKRRLADFERRGWHNRVTVAGTPQVDYVGLVNRADDADDRVVVHVRCLLRDYVEAGGRRILRDDARTDLVMTSEYWTLHKHDGRWRLESIETEAEGAHHLHGELVATPWADTLRLREDAVAERSAADAAPDGFAPAELADLDFDGTARAAALDLALADGRFDPDLIEASVRRAVEAWAQAVDGDDAPLRAVAAPAALDELLHPGDAARRTRLVVRGPRIQTVHIAALDAAAAPPTIAVEVRVSGRRYVEDRDTTAVVAGSRERRRTFTEHWTLALDGDGTWPWRIARTGAPAAA